MALLPASPSERSLTTRSYPLTCAVFALVAGVSGCGSDGNDGSGNQNLNGAPVKFSDIYAMAFPTTTNARCDFCHSMPANEVGNGKLHMGSNKDMAYAALVGQVSISGRCMGRPLVVAGQPDQSLLLLKLSPNPPCGNRMPLGGTPFTDVQLQMVRGWIAAGAPND